MLPGQVLWCLYPVREGLGPLGQSYRHGVTPISSTASFGNKKIQDSQAIYTCLQSLRNGTSRRVKKPHGFRQKGVTAGCRAAFSQQRSYFSLFSF